MGWPDKEQIVKAVLDMLTVNMDLKEGERLLVLTDVPSTDDWRETRETGSYRRYARARGNRLSKRRQPCC